MLYKPSTEDSSNLERLDKSPNFIRFHKNVRKLVWDEYCLV